MSRYLCLMISLVLGCKDEQSCEVDDLGADVARAEVDGSDWAANGGSWSVAGSAVQVSMESASGLTLTLRATADDGGDSVAERVDSGDVPIVVELSGADGHGGVMDLRNGIDAYASNQEGGSGTMTISAVSGDNELSACFEFDAVRQMDGRILQVREGRVTIGQ
tara:strand:- start:5 stop:496 length:492 start_codon:yes stop_codon:yes gene_type:complete